MELGVKIKIINHRLYKAIKNLGYTSILKFCKDHQLAYGLVLDYINLKAYPKTVQHCEKLELALGVPLDNIFPEDLRDAIEQKPVTNLYLHKEVERIPIEFNPLKQIEHKKQANIEDIQESVMEALDVLSGRDREIVEKYYGFNTNSKTLRAIGEEYNIGPERVRQIIAKGLKRIRYRVSRNKLNICKYKGEGKSNGKKTR